MVTSWTMTFFIVSTHSRLKAAVIMAIELSGFNTQPPEGGWI